MKLLDAAAVRTAADPDKIVTYYDRWTAEAQQGNAARRAIVALDEAGYDIPNFIRTRAIMQRQKNG